MFPLDPPPSPDRFTLLSKWTGLVAAIWVQSFAGNSFAYANYSATLKSVLALTQVHLNYIAVSKDFGENVGLLAGIICNKVPPWVILSVAALEGFFGFGTLWLVASGTINPRPLWQMCIAIFVGGNSMTWFNTAVLVTCMRNFPNSRGTIVGFLKGFIGLSGAIFTQIFISLLSNDGVQLLFFLAVGPTLVCLLCMGFIRPVTPVTGESYAEFEEEQKQFRFIYYVCIALSVYLFAVVFVDEFDANRTVLIIAVIGMFLFLVAPIGVPVRIALRILFPKRKTVEPSIEEALMPFVDPKDASVQPSDGKEEAPSVDLMKPKVETRKILTTAEEEDAGLLLALGEGAVKKKRRRPRRGEDFKLSQALVKADFWLLFFAFFCGVGTAVSATNNLSQLAEAQGYTVVSTFVLLSAIWGFVGRLGGGYVSEHFIRSSTLPRPVWIGAAQILLALNHLLFAYALPGTLHIASSLLGLCYGVQIAAIVPTASEIFGLKHFGILYNFITMADPIASLLFSSFLLGNLYDLEVLRQFGTETIDGEQLVCTGAHCFHVAFLVMAGVCVVGACLCIILTVRLKPVYVTLYGGQDSRHASYTSLPSGASYASLPSVTASSVSLPPASFSFPRVGSSTSIADDPEAELR